MTEKTVAAEAETHEVPKANLRNLMMFLVPSLIGVLLFMVPVFREGAMTIPVAILAKGLQGMLGTHLVTIVAAVISVTALLSLWATLFKPASLERFPFLQGLFTVSTPWLVVRTLGAVFAVMTLTGLGPEVVWSGDTGGLVLNDLLPTLFAVFIFAGLFLPLLLNFGLLELVGTLLSKIMRPVFRLPGRSAIDCMASWLGDGTVGVMLTSKQYEQKIYTQREAAVVATTFSAVSITFSLVVIAQVGLEHMFVPFYLAVCLAGVIAAIIVPRLPPLNRKQDVFIDGSKRTEDADLVPAGHTALSFGFEQALGRAARVTSLKAVAEQSVKTAVDMVFAVLPVVMAIGTLGLIVAETTPLFSWLGAPFVPVLELLQIPAAAEASQTMVVGFTDMFVPSILATSIESDMTRFVVAAMSVTQLIYLSEVGAVILGSKIPVNLGELFLVFLVRTLVTLPIIALVAHLVF